MNVQVFVTCPEQAYLYGDEELLTTCLVNFLDNAIKASSPGSYVNVMIDTIDNAVSHIHIRDRGTGIAPDELNKVFQPFYMLRKNKDPLVDGLGLGLAVCQSVSRAHHWLSRRQHDIASKAKSEFLSRMSHEICTRCWTPSGNWPCPRPRSGMKRKPGRGIPCLAFVLIGPVVRALRTVRHMVTNEYL